MNVPELSGLVYSRSGLSLRVKVLPFLVTSSVKVPVIKPNQLRYTKVLSSPSTAATESSQSIIEVKAASIIISLMPAGSWLPIGVVLSMIISKCKPLCKNNNEDGYTIAYYSEELGRPVIKTADWSETEAVLTKGLLKVESQGFDRFKISADFALSNGYTFTAEWEGLVSMKKEG